MHYALSWDILVTEWNQISVERQNDTGLVGFTRYAYIRWMTNSLWSWQIYTSPRAYATTNNPGKVFNVSTKRYTQREASDIWRIILNLLTIAEDYSFGLAPPITTSHVPPTKGAYQLTKVLVSRNRVAVSSTVERSVVEVLYPGDTALDMDQVQHVSELAGSRQVNTERRTTVIVSPSEYLMDTGKVTGKGYGSYFICRW